jgi:uncharacterized glyoxalase superfamily protein PhnB
MSQPEMWITPDVVPSIIYADVPRAVEWLARVFGFRERSEARLSWPGGAMAWIEAGDGLIHLATPDESWRRGPSTIKVYVDDVDAHFARAKAQGAEIVSGLEDGFWGGRIYRAADHEGHRWEISQRGRDLAAHRWRLPPRVTRGA